MRFIAVLFTLALVGCSTPVPKIPKWPQAPSTLLEPCPELKALNKDAKLSDVAKILTDNYSEYYQCSNRVEAWQQWYHIQQKIFEDIK